ncbi:MATE family efflux transporter [Paenibacillus alginolyticus]|uniref:Polysaccharide biosynthesis protein C-terminal domain-containing protein n=1 Tax=Paenibacillus alginolyticus TaxID=59839 RepID=A0ABT4G8P9_9BACL|nr:hypothetical protein [Paenibacillus alginolyticus]MCY9692564.1 hypothetical protein [Paenibacillus alginolyticus]MEC0143770.1 hypothetical protein [Paenibacillus alginolyticus]
MNIKKNILISFMGDFLSKIPLYLSELIIIQGLSTVNYGLWSSYQIFFRFFPYFHFGALSAYNKLGPLHYGANRNEEITKLNNTVFSLIQFISLVLLVTAGLVYVFIGRYISPTQYLLFALCGLCVQYYVFYQAKLKNEASYVKLSLGLMINSLTYMILLYFLVPYLQLSGVFVSLVLAYFISIIYYCLKQSLSFDFDVTYFKQLLSQGFAPFVFTITHFIYQMTDRLVLLLFGNLILMAHYGFIYTICQLVILMTNAIDKVFSTFLLRKIGAGRHEDAGKLSMISCWIVAMATSLCIAGFFLLGDKFVMHLFSDYSDTIQPIKYTLIGVFFFASIQPFFSYIIGINSEKVLIALHITMSLLSSCIYYIVFLVQQTLISVSVAYMVIQMIYFCSLIFIFLRKIQGKTIIETLMDLLRILVVLLSPLLVMISLSGLAVKYIEFTQWIFLNATIQTMAVVILSLPMYWFSYTLLIKLNNRLVYKQLSEATV